MSKTIDIVEPVIDSFPDALNLEENNLEDPNTTSVPVTMSETDIPTMEEEDNEIQQLLDEKREIQSQINESIKKKEIDTEKTILLRNLRAKVRDIGKSLREILEKKSEREYEEQYRREREEKRTKANTEVNSIFGTTTDDLKPNKENEKTFARNFNMFGKYKDSINELRSEIKKLMEKETSEVTQQLIDE